MDYHRDRNGKSLRGVTGYRIRDSRGELFEMAGTGLILPFSGDRINLWTKEQKLVTRRKSEIEIVPDEAPAALIAVPVILGIVTAVAWGLSKVGAL